MCGLDRPAARRRREICPRRRAPAVFTGEKRRLALAACLLLRISETRLSTLCVWWPVAKTCKSNKPPLSDPGTSSEFRRFHEKAKKRSTTRRGTHSFARVRPSRPSADPLGSHAARHDRCVIREVGRTRASRVSRTPSPPATRARFVSAEALVRLPPRGAVRAPGRPERSGNARATRVPSLGSIPSADWFGRPPVTLPRAARARPGRTRRHFPGTVRLLAFFSRSIAPGLAASRRAVAAGSTSFTLFRHY